jgi:ectoine hydroxylase-related dioxygenase (phytanoyl-CoA dioxygenase family)
MNKGDMVLFSSQMIHYVKKNTRTEDRISLGFNTMVGGEILMHTPNKLNMMVH